MEPADAILPVVLLDTRGVVKRFLGTAFFFSPRPTILSVAHVLGVRPEPGERIAVPRREPPDITKLLGPVTWTYYYLYVLLDIFSRYVVGWLLARQEAVALATVLIAESCERQHIRPDQLIIHADRGPSMTSQPLALLLAISAGTRAQRHLGGLDEQVALYWRIANGEIPYYEK